MNHTNWKWHLDMAIKHAETHARSWAHNGEAVTAEGWAWAEDDNGHEMIIDDELRRPLHGWDDHDSNMRCVRCVFDDNCPTCPSAEEALDHMYKFSGFFVSHHEFLTDAAGLVRYVPQKVCIVYARIACSNGSTSVDDARRHMNDVRHRRMTSNEDMFRSGARFLYTAPS